jgi:anti-sigma factor RsiW
MFDFLRNRGRSEQEKRQEALNAYLDGELAPAERDRFEQQLALDSDLRDELADIQFWQQQMRDLPTRRMPRNFTLDPAVYGRPQRSYWESAYPALRTATALTAFLFIIALAANVYMTSFSTAAPSQAVVAPAFEAAPMAAVEVEESAQPESLDDSGEMVAEEELPVEESVVEAESGAAADAALLPGTMAASPPATPFALESSIDKESEAAEAPIEIAESEKTVPAEAAAGESAEQPMVSEQEGPIAEELRQELSQSLDIVEGKVESPPPATAREAIPSSTDENENAEEITSAEAPLAFELPEIDEEQSAAQLPAPVDETSLAANIPSFLGLDSVSLVLGLLLISLIVLTLVARGRR